jgi:hypothetical protein
MSIAGQERDFSGLCIGCAQRAIQSRQRIVYECEYQRRSQPAFAGSGKPKFAGCVEPVQSEQPSPAAGPHRPHVFASSAHRILTARNWTRSPLTELITREIEPNMPAGDAAGSWNVLGTLPMSTALQHMLAASVPLSYNLGSRRSVLPLKGQGGFH